MPSKSDQVRDLLATGVSVADIAKKVGCTPNLVYVINAHAKAGKRGPGRPPKVKAAASGLDGLAGILDAVRTATDSGCSCGLPWRRSRRCSRTRWRRRPASRRRRSPSLPRPVDRGASLARELDVGGGFGAHHAHQPLRLQGQRDADKPPEHDGLLRSDGQAVACPYDQLQHLVLFVGPEPVHGCP